MSFILIIGIIMAIVALTYRAAENPGVSGNNKKKNPLFLLLLAIALGALVGGLVWLFLKVMGEGIDLIWEILPGKLDFAFYPIVVCGLGGLAVGFCQKKYSGYPETLETVIEKFKKDGGYEYKMLHGLILCALLPLLFGGSIGPEAGLSGIIAGLCSWIGTHFKDLEKKSKKRAFYIVSALTGAGCCYIMTEYLGGGMHISRFDGSLPALGDLLWFIPLALIGIAAGAIYFASGKLVDLILKPVARYIVIRAVIGGVVLGIFGMFFAYTMFSGEEEMGEIMADWAAIPAMTLFFYGVLKLVMINICIKSGWRGGHIFPLIFAGICLGYAMAALTGIEGVFATAVTTAALCGAVMGQPPVVAALLLLCYPVVNVLFLFAAAFVGAKAGKLFKFLKLGTE